MKFIKLFDQYINEGAHLIPPTYDKIELSWNDDKSLPLEVLKSNKSHKITGFRKVGITKDGSFQLYYGLTVDPSRNRELGDSDPLFKITLDTLKKANILNSESALFKFTEYTAKEIRSKKGKIDYVVSLGSTAGLSQDLGKAFSRHFGGSKFIPLSKYEFDNFEQALNWNYISAYDRKVREEGARPILSRVKQDIIDAIDTEKTSNQIIQAIGDAHDADELRGILLKANPKNRYHEYSEDDENTIFWINEPYSIRSSGIAHGGSRQWLKTKYDTPKSSGEFGETEFMEAIKKCVFGNATMLFVDDNSRTKEDISKIFDAVIKVAENLIANSDAANDKSVSQYHKRFLAYVLMYIPDAISTGDAGDIRVKSLATAAQVQQFLNGGLDNIKNWINNQ